MINSQLKQPYPNYQQKNPGAPLNKNISISDYQPATNHSFQSHNNFHVQRTMTKNYTTVNKNYFLPEYGRISPKKFSLRVQEHHHLSTRNVPEKSKYHERCTQNRKVKQMNGNSSPNPEPTHFFSGNKKSLNVGFQLHSPNYGTAPKDQKNLAMEKKYSVAGSETHKFNQYTQENEQKINFQVLAKKKHIQKEQNWNNTVKIGQHRQSKVNFPQEQVFNKDTSVSLGYAKSMQAKQFLNQGKQWQRSPFFNFKKVSPQKKKFDLFAYKNYGIQPIETDRYDLLSSLKLQRTQTAPPETTQLSHSGSFVFNKEVEDYDRKRQYRKKLIEQSEQSIKSYTKNNHIDSISVGNEKIDWDLDFGKKEFRNPRLSLQGFERERSQQFDFQKKKLSPKEEKSKKFQEFEFNNQLQRHISKKKLSDPIKQHLEKQTQKNYSPTNSQSFNKNQSQMRHKQDKKNKTLQSQDNISEGSGQKADYDYEFRKFDNMVQLNLLKLSSKDKSSPSSSYVEAGETSGQKQKISSKVISSNLTKKSEIYQEKANNYQDKTLYKTYEFNQLIYSKNPTKTDDSPQKKERFQPFREIQDTDCYLDQKKKDSIKTQTLQTINQKNTSKIDDVFEQLQFSKSGSLPDFKLQKTAYNYKESQQQKSYSPSKTPKSMKKKLQLYSPIYDNPSTETLEILVSKGISLTPTRYQLPHPSKKTLQETHQIVKAQFDLTENKKSIILSSHGSQTQLSPRKKSRTLLGDELRNQRQAGVVASNVLNNKMFEIRQFQLGKTVGSGRYGDVLMARHKKSGFILSIKKVLKGTIKEINIIDQFVNEIKLHAKLSHQNIIQLYNFFQDEFHIFILMEYADSGTLLDYLQSQKFKVLENAAKEKKISQIIFQLLNALFYMHRLGIIHRDIKLENILLTHDESLKLCDFGYSTDINSGMKKTFCGTLDYIAPQIMQKNIAQQEMGYDQSVDLWATGVLTYQLFVGKAPYFDEYRKIQKLKTYKNKSNSFKNDIKEWAEMFKTASVDYTKGMTPLGRSFVQSLLNPDPKKRLNVSQALAHPFIRKYNTGEKISSFQDKEKV